MSRSNERPPAGLHALAVPLVIVLALAAVAAIGRAAPIGDKVAITLHDDRIEMPDTLIAGTTTFGVTNQGTLRHGLVIRAPGDSAQVTKLDMHLEPGESATLEVALNAGRYEVYCPIGGHRQRGLVHRLAVVAERPPAEAGGF